MLIHSKQFLYVTDNGQTFVRPNLTSNGTLGGSSFAVSSSVSSSNPYLAFDNNSSTSWSIAAVINDKDITFYNPKPLKVEKIIIDYTSFYDTEIELEGSNDNSIWETITLANNVLLDTSNATTTFNVLNPNKKYKYHKIIIKVGDGINLTISDIRITATEYLV